jgi:hypothetical protein
MAGRGAMISADLIDPSLFLHSEGYIIVGIHSHCIHTARASWVYIYIYFSFGLLTGVHMQVGMSHAHGKEESISGRCESCLWKKLCDMKTGAKYILYKAVMSQNDCGKHAIFEIPIDI